MSCVYIRQVQRLSLNFFYTIHPLTLTTITKILAFCVLRDILLDEQSTQGVKEGRGQGAGYLKGVPALGSTKAFPKTPDSKSRSLASNPGHPPTGW